MSKSISLTDEVYEKLEAIRAKKEEAAGCEIKMASVIESLIKNDKVR